MVFITCQNNASSISTVCVQLRVMMRDVLNSLESCAMSRGVIESVWMIFSKCSRARFPIMNASMGEESNAANAEGKWRSPLEQIDLVDKR